MMLGHAQKQINEPDTSEFPQATSVVGRKRRADVDYPVSLENVFQLLGCRSGVPAGGNVGAVAGTEPSRTKSSSPAGVLSTSTRAVSLSTQNECATPTGTTAAAPGRSSKRCSPA